ncbi:MAG: chromosome segregation protein SMC [Clostridium sp.]
MFLKSLEIRGFKSFADKIELQFESGITAVVGPNGSGKSNVTDAVRWVLGEQSIKNLRGAKMEDVIFAGTQFRKPVGLAQVSITINNDERALDIDYSDVKITRRLYRSGESEYYINNNKCRLKDIQELFMDTGIGKEGYSLIGQGKIEAVLSGRPEERRALLEEAAGIVKFKNRKEEAEKRLYNTSQNLIRINDIIGTYEDRIEPLRVEMEKAKEFLTLSEDLKIKEINSIVDRVVNIDSKIENVNVDIEKANEDIANNSGVKDEFKDKSQYFSKELEKYEYENSIKQDEYYKKKTLKQETDSQVRVLQEKINNIINFISSSNSAIDELNLKHRNAIELTKQQELELLEISGSKDEILLKINELENLINAMDNSVKTENEALQGYKSNEINLNNSILVKNNIIMNINRDIESLQKEIENLKIQCEDFLGNLKINKNTENILGNEKSKIKEEISDNEKELNFNKKQLDEMRSKLINNENIQRDFTKSLNKVEANKTVLTNLQKQFEGYTRAIKVLMTHIKSGNIKDLSNNCYVLGEVIEVEKQHEVAIEIALGAGISNVITKSSEDAKILINYLKKNNIGRGTFLPLDIIRGKSLSLSKDIVGYSGFVGVASELISYEGKFTKAIEYALGNVAIAKTMDDALYIAKKTNTSFRIVTLEGEVINPGGSLTGGNTFHKSTSIISRKREIKELEERHNELLLNLKEITTNIKSIIKGIEEIDEYNLDLRDKIHFNKIELVKIESRISIIIEENKKTEILLNEKHRLLNSLVDRLANNKENLNEEEEYLQNCKRKYEEVISAMRNLEDRVKSTLDNINEYKEELTDYKINKAKVDEILVSKSKDLERIHKETVGYDENIGKLMKELELNNKSKEIFRSNIKYKENLIHEINLEIIILEEEIKDIEVEKVKVKDFIRNHSDKLEELSNVIGKFDKELNKQCMILAKLETERDYYYNKLNEDFNLTYAEASEYAVEELDFNKLRAEINEIKTRISAMGLVNVGAIEEYKEIKEKFTFMNAEREDLLSAKGEIEEVIEDITTKMKEVFTEKLAVLNKNFDETFKELFKGGSADLILAEGDELTGKIDINVQPPGKKLQNINLMSGGEKVLSAIALVFAILKMKPTPFCILDEIEAALDDANINRYAEFLKQFSDRTQFIVITHRKGTMSVSNTLYGVTMEEKGVSKVVSVDLASGIV